jgi:hypothetical protein
MECPMRKLIVPALFTLVIGSAAASDDGKAKDTKPAEAATAGHRPEGKWEGGREATSSTLKLTLEKGRFSWLLLNTSNNSVLLEGDYSVTKDSMVFGVITKVTTYSMPAKEKAGLPEEDDTFSFRFRVDDDELNIKALRGKGFDLLQSGVGRYRKKTEPAPRIPQIKMVDKPKRKGR